jgi:SAM-dependent methyltransferase
MSTTETPPTRYVPALRFRLLTRLFDPILALTLPEGERKARLVAQADLRPGHRVLDLGAGTGTLALMLEQAQPEARVVGIDGDPEILGLARRKVAEAGRQVQFVEALADDLPFPTGSFDRVVSSLVFHHLDRATKGRALAEARRVLRPGATLHILDWGKAQDPLMRLAYLTVQLLDGFATTADNVRGDLVPLMEEAGFVQVRETERRRTAFGTLSLYRAEAPAA